MSTTGQLERLISDAQFGSPPPAVVEAAKVVILDGLAVTLAGETEPAVRVLRLTPRQYYRRPQNIRTTVTAKTDRGSSVRKTRSH